MTGQWASHIRTSFIAVLTRHPYLPRIDLLWIPISE